MWWQLLNHVLAPAPRDLNTFDSIGSTYFCVSNNSSIGTYTPKGTFWAIGTFLFVGTYTLKGAFTRKGTYKTEGTFLTHAKTPVAGTGFAPQRVS